MIWQVTNDFLSGSFNLLLPLVFLLPVGIGLLRGKPKSRWWASFWIFMGYIFCGCLVTHVLTSHNNIRLTFLEFKLQGKEAVPYCIGFIVLCALFLYTLKRLLYSVEANYFFRYGVTK